MLLEDGFLYTNRPAGTEDDFLSVNVFHVGSSAIENLAYLFRRRCEVGNRTSKLLTIGELV